MHACMQAGRHAGMQACMHPYIHAGMHASIHNYIHTYHTITMTITITITITTTIPYHYITYIHTRSVSSLRHKRILTQVHSPLKCHAAGKMSIRETAKWVKCCWHEQEAG